MPCQLASQSSSGFLFSSFSSDLKMLAAGRRAGPSLLLARKAFASAVTAPTPPAGAELTLFSHRICPYCCRTKVCIFRGDLCH